MFKFQTEAVKIINGKPTPARMYLNEQTGTTMTTYRLFVDKTGKTWWTFEDLFTIPFIRQMVAKKVIDLYGHGLSLDDIRKFSTDFKTLLKSTDAERYERCYAKVLEFESLANTMADPVKQCIGLATLYVLYEDEKPDAYDNSIMSQKMQYLSIDLDAQAFFLNWWTDCMRHSGAVLKSLSKIVSTSPAAK